MRIATEEMGMKTKRNDPDVIYRMCCFLHDRDTPEVTNGLNPQLFLEAMEAQDPITCMPEEYIMAGRVSMLMRGMANAFGLRLKVSDHWGHYVNRM